MELEEAAAAEGLVLAMVRTNEEFRREPQYTDVLSKMPLITVEKIGESEPVPLKANGDNLPLAGVRALGMGHVIAGAAIGRDMALYGADVLNIWRPRDSEIEAFAWDVQVGMRSTILDDAKEDREKFNQLLQDADVFFANKRPGFLKKHDLDADALCQQKPGLIHATVVLHGEKGPWSNRPGFDEIGSAVSGLFAIEGSPTQPKQPPIVPICDNVVGWLGTTGILAALRRRAIEGGSYRVVVSLTRTVLWLLSLGIFDKAYAKATAGSSDEHMYIAPDLFTAETPLGTYQGMTDQIVMSRTPGAYRTVLVPAWIKQTRMASERKMIAPIHNMLALINPAALPALRIAATFFFIIYLLFGAYIFRNRHRFFDRDPNVDNDIPAVRQVRVELVLIPWLGITTLILVLLISFWLA